MLLNARARCLHGGRIKTRMTDFPAVVSTFARYAEMIRPLLTHDSDGAGAADAFEGESATAVRIERGAIFARAARGDSPERLKPVERLIDLASSPRLSQVAVIDRAGNHRALYRPLLIYAWLQSYRTWYETLPPDAFGRWDEALRPWCDLLEAELETVGVSDAGIPATYGAAVAEAAWSALALHVAGKVFVRDAWTDLASDTFGQLARGQQPGGPFLAAAPSDHPELAWYHELAILHAAGSYAAQAEDRKLSRHVSRSASYLFREVQPDHATTQPWGAFPFIWAGDTAPLADQLLHAITLGRASTAGTTGSGGDGVSLILLADALYCLRLFL